VTWWSVTIEAEGEDRDLVTADAMEDLLPILDDYSPVVIAPSEDSGATPVRYGVDLSVNADEAGYAAAMALGFFQEAVAKVDLPAWPIVKLVVITEAELDASLSQSNFPVLVGVSELADLIGVSRQRASELAHSGSFPAPVATLASGPVWIEPAILRYVEEWERRPGRPKAAAQ
jgi:hypothetical protein